MLGVFKSDGDKALKDPLIAAEEGGSVQGKAKMESVTKTDSEATQRSVESGDPTNGQGLTDGQVLQLRAEWGENKLPENKKSKLFLLLLAFTSPMACLIWVAVLIELIIGATASTHPRLCTPPCTHASTHPRPCSPTLSPTHPHTHPLTPSTDSLTHPPTHPHTHPLIHSLIH